MNYYNNNQAYGNGGNSYNNMENFGENTYGEEAKRDSKIVDLTTQGRIAFIRKVYTVLSSTFKTNFSSTPSHCSNVCSFHGLISLFPIPDLEYLADLGRFRWGNHHRNLHVLLPRWQKLPKRLDLCLHFHPLLVLHRQLHLLSHRNATRKRNRFHRSSHDLRYIFLITIAIVVALTLYAIFTPTDFTTCGGLLVVLTAVIIILFIIMLFTDSKIVHLIYCGVGVFLFGLYLVIDTQMIMGGRSMEYSFDEHCFAAMNLYIDIIQIFLYILQILGSSND